MSDEAFEYWFSCWTKDMPEYLSIPYRPGALFVWRAAQASKEEEIKAAVQSEREAILALFDQYDYEDIADVIRARSEK